MHNLMKKYLLLIVVIVSITSLCYFALPADAQTNTSVRDLLNSRYSSLKGEVTGNSLPSTQIQFVIVDIIRRVLTFLGLITVIMIIWGGYLWLTAGGNADQVKKAKSYLINASIGVAIVIMAFIITRAVITVAIGTSYFGCTRDNDCPNGWYCSVTTRSCLWR